MIYIYIYIYSIALDGFVAEDASRKCCSLLPPAIDHFLYVLKQHERGYRKIKEDGNKRIHYINPAPDIVGFLNHSTQVSSRSHPLLLLLHGAPNPFKANAYFDRGTRIEVARQQKGMCVACLGWTRKYVPRTCMRNPLSLDECKRVLLRPVDETTIYMITWESQR